MANVIERNCIPDIFLQLKDELEDFGLFRCEFIGAHLVLFQKNTNHVYLTVNHVKGDCYMIFYNFWIEEYCKESELIAKVKEGLYKQGKLPIYKALEALKANIN